MRAIRYHHVSVSNTLDFFYTLVDLHNKPFSNENSILFCGFGFSEFLMGLSLGQCQVLPPGCGCNTTLIGYQGNMSHITTPLYPQPDLCVVFVSAGSCVAGG
jgi:hypothetical protein